MANKQSRLNMLIDGDKVSIESEICDSVLVTIMLKDIMTMILEGDLEDGLTIIETAKDLALSELAEKKVQEAVKRVMTDDNLRCRFDELIN